MAANQRTQMQEERPSKATRRTTRDTTISPEALKELLCQALETEIGGQEVYEAAIQCAQNDDLKREWEGYLEETRNHERLLRGVFEAMGWDAEEETPGRTAVRQQAE